MAYVITSGRAPTHPGHHGAAGLRAVHQLGRCRATSSAGVSRHFDLGPGRRSFGALPFIYGTVVTSALALLIGIPLGVGAAIFLAELAPPKFPMDSRF